MQEFQTEKDRLLDLWDFNWGVMDVLMGGKSSIDLKELRFRDQEETTSFLKYYGYDLQYMRDQRKVHAVIVESWNFIQKYLMPIEWSRGKLPPDDLLYADDARILLSCASDLSEENSLRQVWACAVLRVMHTIAHIDGVYSFTDFDHARTQIMDRFHSFMFRDKDTKLFVGTHDINVPIERVEWKEKKSRDSIILKLLHKKANVADTIYDLLGVRIITEHLGDVMVVVKFLRDYHMVTFPNCNPSRARNTLIDVEGFKNNVEMLRNMLESDRLSPEEFSLLVSKIAQPARSTAGKTTNPHTARAYRSIQLTCRQMIRFQNPSFTWRRRLEELKGRLNPDSEASILLEEIIHLSRNGGGQKETANWISGFFPFEVQVMDKETAKDNSRGEASHDRYKKSQIKAARRRVLAGVLTHKSYRKKSVG